MFYDIVDEQIEVTGKAFLGLSIACARCHDHKFDPISTKDYYSLASIFASTKQLSKIEGTVSQLYFAPLAPKDIAERYEAHLKRVEDKQKEISAVSAAEGRRLPRCARASNRGLHDRRSKGLRVGRRCCGHRKRAFARSGSARALDKVPEAYQRAPRSPGRLVSCDSGRSRPNR